MEKYFTIGEAAKEAHVTAETLRHYDRIGLVAPSRREENTGYRYYTQEDIVRLHTVRALQQMDLPLKKIREVLQENDLRAVIAFLDEAEKRLRSARLCSSAEKRKLAWRARAMRRNCASGKARRPPSCGCGSSPRARSWFQTRWKRRPSIPCSITCAISTMRWPPRKGKRSPLKTRRGILRKSGKSRMFAVCVRYVPNEAVEILPAGRYLCADCTEDNKDEVVERLMREADAQWGARPQFAVLMVFLSGVLQWSYQAQVYTGDAGAQGNSSGNVDAPRKSYRRTVETFAASCYNKKPSWKRAPGNRPGPCFPALHSREKMEVDST